MSGENNPHFDPFDEPQPATRRSADRRPTETASYLRDHPRVVAMFNGSTDPTLADMKRFNDALEVIESWPKPKP